jgi:hypothetical protein
VTCGQWWRTLRCERWRATVGANIASYGSNKRMTQQAFALTSGVTCNVLIDAEQGKRGLLYGRLFDIAKAPQVSLGALFEGSAGSG